MEGTEEKRQKLAEMMDKLAGEDIMVAFSGGVDSSLLLKAACDSAGRTGKKVYAVTIQTALHPTEDIEVAGRVAKEMGAVHVILSVDELAEAGIEDNPVDRCYRCKKLLFQKMKKKAQELGVPVLCFGLRTDFLTHMFPGSMRLMELADSITEIKTVCACGSKATVNARVTPDGRIVTEGEQVFLGGNDAYVAMCHRCWKKKISEQGTARMKK